MKSSQPSPLFLKSFICPSLGTGLASTRQDGLASLLRTTSVSILLSGAAYAQYIEIDNVANTGSPYYPLYSYTQNGYNPVGPVALYNFTFDVTSGSGLGSSLVGGNYMGFCVNPFLSDPADGYYLDVDSTGTVLSYAVNGSGDYWNTNTSVKYAAFKDVLAAYAPLMVSLPKNSQDYADLITAFSILSCELALDYDGTTGSINTAAGDSLVTNESGGAPSGNVASLFNSMTATIGGGGGSGFTLYSAAWPDPDPSVGSQDMVFFNVNSVPEPSGALLAALAATAVSLRRRRR